MKGSRKVVRRKIKIRKIVGRKVVSRKVEGRTVVEPGGNSFINASPLCFHFSRSGCCQQLNVTFLIGHPAAADSEATIKCCGFVPPPSPSPGPAG
jgi:hypothetical protein